MSTKYSNKVTTRARLIYGRQVKTCGYPNLFWSNSKLNYLSCNRVIFLNIMHIENIGKSMFKASLAFLLFLTVTILTIRGAHSGQSIRGNIAPINHMFNTNVLKQ